MTHFFKPNTPLYKNHFAPFVIGALVVLYLLFSSTGCAEQREQPELSGAWSSITYDANYYLFQDGILEIHSVIAGQIVWQKWYAYEHRQETGALEIRDRNGVYFQGSVSFTPDADTAFLSQPGGLQITLERW